MESSNLIDPAGLAGTDRSHTGMNSVEALDYAIKRIKGFFTQTPAATAEKAAAIETLTALRDMIAEGPRADARQTRP